jgi:hypothetical protein
MAGWKMKKCSLCGEEKSKDLFGKSSNSKDGLRSRCKVCRSVESKEYRHKYRQEVLDRKKKWYQDTISRAKERTNKALKEGARECTQCNKIKPILEYRKRPNGGFYSKCKLCENFNNKVYRKNNPELINELKVVSENKRREKAKNLKNTFNRHEWKRCKLYFINSCAYCGKELQNLTQDHFIPLSKNGEYTKYNIVPSCKSCNSEKNNKNPYEWFEQNKNISLEKINKIEEYFRSL